MKKNNTIYYIKGLAIISVISAHCNSVPLNSNGIVNALSLFLQNIGTFGVICFFVISGYLFCLSDLPSLPFFINKFKKIVLPWIISASCVYLYVYLRKPPINLFGYFNFLIGNGSYCYYLTNLMLLYLLYHFLSVLSRKSIIIFTIFLTICSSVFFYDISVIPPFLNLLNWIGYFAFGVGLYRGFIVTNRFTKFIKSNLALTFIINSCIIVIILFYQISNFKSGTYWGLVGSILSWFGAFEIYLLSVVLKKKNSGIFKNLVYYAGIYSFFIYLWHMPFAALIAKIMNFGFLKYFVLIRPLLVLLIMLLGIFVLKKIIYKFGFKKLAKFLGLQF